jgi:hypothetical protein
VKEPHREYSSSRRCAKVVDPQYCSPIRCRMLIKAKHYSRLGTGFRLVIKGVAVCCVTRRPAGLGSRKSQSSAGTAGMGPSHHYNPTHFITLSETQNRIRWPPVLILLDCWVPAGPQSGHVSWNTYVLPEGAHTPSLEYNQVLQFWRLSTLLKEHDGNFIRSVGYLNQ